MESDEGSEDPQQGGTGMSGVEFIECSAKYGKCPFCGNNRQFVTAKKIDRHDYVMPDGSLVPAIEGTIHCLECGAKISKIAPSKDEAIQDAIDQWRARA